jgi:hypothetical protein
VVLVVVGVASGSVASGSVFVTGAANGSAFTAAAVTFG